MTLKYVVRKSLSLHHERAKEWLSSYLEKPKFLIHDVTNPDLLAEEELTVFLHLTNEIDAQYEQIQGEFRESPSCSRGCHHCCNHAIYVSQRESRIIEAWITRNFAFPQLSELRKTIDEWHQEYVRAGFGKELDHSYSFKEAYFGHHLTCPLLTENGECAIYRVRPSACRNYLSYDSPDKCSNSPFVENTVIADGWARALHFSLVYSYESSRSDIARASSKLSGDKASLLPLALRL